MSLRMFVAAAAVAACASLAGADQVKIEDFSAAGPGLMANPHADGMASFEEHNDAHAGPGIKLHLHMKDLMPHTMYGFAVYVTGNAPENGADYSNPQGLVTDGGGNSTVEVFLPTWDFEFLGCIPRIQIYAWDGNSDPDAVNFVSASELRADALAHPTTIKIRDFNAAGPGLMANPRADGMADFQEHTDSNLGFGLKLHLHMKDLQRNTMYGVAIYTSGVDPAGGADYSNPQAFTTDGGGNFTFETFLPTWDVYYLGCTPRIQIYQWDGNTDPASIGIVTPAELRADGVGDY